MSESPGEYILRLRGLPWQATKEDVVSFFSDSKIKGGVNGIFMTLSTHGRPSGEAYVEMESEEDVTKGLEKHKKNIGSRYIEVFTSTRNDMDWALRRTGPIKSDVDPGQEGFVRLRGLPFDCTDDDIRKFFTGMTIVRDGIIIPMDHHGRSSGEAYVQFISREVADKAMGKHKEKIGHRYIEIFKSSSHEFLAVRNQQIGYMDRSSYGGGSRSGGGYGSSDSGYGSYDPPYPPSKRNYYLPSSRSTPYDRNYNRYQSGGGHWGSGSSRPPLSELGFRRPYAAAIMDDSDRGSNKRFARRTSEPDNFYWDKYEPHRQMIHMRGLPYKATEEDIEKFFRPYVPIFISILYDDLHRPSGEADVEFATPEEATGAMSKNKSNMEMRYIELFLRSNSGSSGPSHYGSGDLTDHPSGSGQRYPYSGHQSASSSYAPNNHYGGGDRRGGGGYNSGPRGNYHGNSMRMNDMVSEGSK